MVSRFLIVFLLLTGAAFSQSFVGFVDGYYGYNFNKPVSGKNLYRNFDFNHNQFSLNYAELAIEQKRNDKGILSHQSTLTVGVVYTYSKTR